MDPLRGRPPPPRTRGTPTRASLEAARRSAEAQLDQLTIRQRLAHEQEARKGEIPAVLDPLHLKAKQGNVQAAREQRGWYDQAFGKRGESSLDTGDVDRPYADMTPEERARLRARIIREIAEREAAEPEAAEQAEASPPATPPPQTWDSCG